MKPILFIDVCITPHDVSRTKQFCEKYFLKENIKKDDIETVELSKINITSFTKEMLLKRDNYIRNNDYSDIMFDLAKQFKKAKMIIIGAPYWDLSFPSILKVYIEHIMVNGLTFHYENNKPLGLCNANKMIYLTTAGGIIGKNNFGFDYIKAICEMLNIKDVEFISDEGLDIK